MKIIAIVATFCLLFAVSASSQQGASASNTTYDPTRAFLLSAADVAAHAARLDASVAYANTTVLERADPASATGLAYRLAVDRRTPPQRAAQHAAEAEFWAIVDGSGAITTDGRIVDIVENGQTVGRRIEGGTVHRVSRGDFLVIPEGVPHQVTEFDPSLLIVTFEFPR
jgi:mannose-6-phosphate isomerase-like protein (cupin superfamily)